MIIPPLDAVGSPPPAGDHEELIVTGGIDDVVKIWRYRFSLNFFFRFSVENFSRLDPIKFSNEHFS